MDRDVQPVADDWGLLTPEDVTRLRYELGEVARLPALRTAHHQLFDGLNLQPDSTVLDVGCGPWLWERLLRRRTGPDALLFGVDPNRGFVEAAARPNVFVADGLALPFPSRVFDAVFCSRVLTHVGPADILIDEMVRVARRGGMVGAFEWTFSQWQIEDGGGPVSDAIHDALIDRHLRPDMGVELPDLLRDAGVTAVTAVPYRERIIDPAESPVTMDLIRRYVANVRAEGKLPEDAVDRWYDDLLQRIVDGHFAFVRTGVAAWGKV